MKINSPFGKMEGKIGNIIIATRGGEVIGREYNPNVANPNTEDQRNVRSRFKLCSQLSAIMKNEIAIRKVGNVTARNQFLSVNYESSINTVDGAAINLSKVQLTKSSRTMTDFSADRSSGTSISVALDADASNKFDRVVYVGYKKLSGGVLELHDSTVVSDAGNDGAFVGTLNYTSAPLVVYAYGIEDLDSAISTKFGNMYAPTAGAVAQLLVSNAENMASVSLSKTKGLQMAANATSGSSDDEDDITITCSANPAGAGVVPAAQTVEFGDTVNLLASANEGYNFVNWTLDGVVVGTNESLTITATEDAAYVANFVQDSTVTVSVAASPDTVATVSGGGNFEVGDSVTVTTTKNQGFDATFDGWYSGDSKLSSSQSYTFTASASVSLVATWQVDE